MSATTFTSVNRRPLVVALVAGALVRALTLPLPGTGDVLIWKCWSYNAATSGESRLYGVGATASTPQYHLLKFRDFESIVDYPPLSIYELGAAGRVYLAATGGRFSDTRALTIVIKALPVLFEAGLIVLLYGALRRVAGEEAARWAVVIYWLNPAAIINSSLGGYLDALFVLPAVGSLVAAVFGWPFVSGGLIAAAVLTKPQGLFLVPAVCLAIWNAGDSTRFVRAVAAWAGVMCLSAVVVAPVVAAGGTWNMVHAVATQTGEVYLSMQGYNMWWLAGHFMWVAYAWKRGLDAWAVFFAPVVPIPFVRAAVHGLPHLRVAGSLLALMGIGWGVWIGRRARDLSLLAAVGAFSMHAYATLGPQVHENHLFAALPLLVLAATTRRRFVPILAGATVVLALSMSFYYFTGDEASIALWSRTVTVVDATLLIAIGNCALLVWHAVVLRDEARVSLAASR